MFWLRNKKNSFPLRTLTWGGAKNCMVGKSPRSAHLSRWLVCELIVYQRFVRQHYSKPKLVRPDDRPIHGTARMDTAHRQPHNNKNTTKAEQTITFPQQDDCKTREDTKIYIALSKDPAENYHIQWEQQQTLNQQQQFTVRITGALIVF